MKLLRFSLSAALLLAAAAAPSTSHAIGGPDAWGYTWASSDDVGGPTFEWIDIEGVGTPVAGLGDDNASVPLDLTMAFPYYWGTYTSLIVGSNGWVGFERSGNLAACLPQMPTAGGFDNFLAPFMTDLTFAGEGNPGRVLTYRANTPDRFIVSYIDVPYFAANAAGYAGSNTFQVVLDADGTITFNYLATDSTNVTFTSFCGADIEIGIENVTGNIGLEALNEAVPASGSAIRFVPPTAPTFEIKDATPEFPTDPHPNGQFVELGTRMSVRFDVSNVGSTAFSNPISGVAQVVAPNGETVGTFDWAVPALVPFDFYSDQAGEVVVDSTGTYTVRNTASSSEDINPGNNTSEFEWQVIDPSAGPTRLSYARPGPFASVAAVNLAPGVAFTYIAPPRGDGTIVAIDAYIVALNATPAGSYSVALYAPDPSTGQPGARLETAIASSSVLAEDGWTRFELGADYPLPLEGVWVAFESDSADYALGIDPVGPFSHLVWEETSGVAPYRQMSTSDFMIGVVAEFAPDETGDDVGGGDAGEPDAGGDVDQTDTDEGDSGDDATLPPDADSSDGSGDSDTNSPTDDVVGSDTDAGGGGSSGGCAAAPRAQPGSATFAGLVAAAVVLTRRRRRNGT